MGSTIKWETDWKIAISKAQAEKTPVFVYFFNPDCIGCKQMEAVTYPDAHVVEFMLNNVITLKVPFNAEPLASDFNIKWTPTFVTVDWNGMEHHRAVGFLPPEELIISVLLGMAKTYYDLDQFAAAIQALEKITEKYPKSAAAPEAIFFLGVSRFKHTGDPSYLKKAYEKLAAEYKESEWAKRALPYRLIP